MVATRFDDLPSHVQDDLTDWYNLSELDDDDKARLADLYESGRFHAWHCPTCGERVRSGEPEDWGRFQGVLNPSYESFPGNPDIYLPEIIERQCDDCRMRSVFAEPQDEAPEY